MKEQNNSEPGKPGKSPVNRWDIPGARQVGGSQIVGVPAATCLQNARIALARRMLIETNLPIAKIAKKCGFSDPFYFSRRFRLENGETAGSYRERNRTLE